MNNNNHYAVIMAGGIGSRFWPVSTEEFPKQFHDLLGAGQSLLQKTFSRINSFIPAENILILTNERYEDLVLEQLPKVTKNQLVLEPAMRNTAPCILLSALKIQKEDPNAVMLVAPSDHWIEDEAAFARNIETAFDTCTAHDVLMTLGIQPTFPNTGYGYIQFDNTSDNAVNKVSQFTEKPDYKTAQSFLKQGNYLWNAGIFIWSVKSITQAFANYLPEMHQLFTEAIPLFNTVEERTFIKDNYHLSENISIDYGILEKANNVHTLAAAFDWNDLGTWGSLYDKLDKDEQGNAVVRAKTVLLSASGNMIQTDAGKQVVVSNLTDYIIVDKGNTLIIVPKNQEQEIKQIREKVKRILDKNE